MYCCCLITANLLLLMMIIIIIINICLFIDVIIINTYFKSTIINNLIVIYSVCSYQTECLPHQKCFVGPQRQIGKASSTAGLQLQPNDAAIYTGSHSLDTHLQMGKNKTKTHPPDCMWPFISVCKWQSYNDGRMALSSTLLVESGACPSHAHSGWWQMRSWGMVLITDGGVAERRGERGWRGG